MEKKKREYKTKVTEFNAREGRSKGLNKIKVNRGLKRGLKSVNG